MDGRKCDLFLPLPLFPGSDFPLPSSLPPPSFHGQHQIRTARRHSRCNHLSFVHEAPRKAPSVPRNFASAISGCNCTKCNFWSPVQLHFQLRAISHRPPRPQAVGSALARFCALYMTAHGSCAAPVPTQTRITPFGPPLARFEATLVVTGRVFSCSLDCTPLHMTLWSIRWTQGPANYGLTRHSTRPVDVVLRESRESGSPVVGNARSGESAADRRRLCLTSETPPTASPRRIRRSRHPESSVALSSMEYGCPRRQTPTRDGTLLICSPVQLKCNLRCKFLVQICTQVQFLNAGAIARNF